MSSWSGVLYKVRFQEAELSDIRIKIIDLAHENMNIKKLFKNYDISLDVSSTKFNTSNLEILGIQEFENRTTAFLATSRYANANYYSDLEDSITEILRLIDLEIQ